ncbi:MAG: hypothetical protein WCD69_02950, partial [Xanthobacteraceae bacterium]
IDAFSANTGDISVSTASASDSITSGGTGILAISEATALSASAGSTITVTTNGTINSGSNLDTGGQAPGGIKAGYIGGATSAANLNVTGNVIVDNSASITAAAGWGINAFDYGNGTVTVNDSAQTTVSGPIGIWANQDSGGTGDVDITVTAGASASTGAVITGTATYGIEASSNGTGNISVTTGANDIINSSSTGILAINAATVIPETDGAITNAITVTAYGTINSGSTLEGGSFSPAGIDASYKGGLSNAPNLNVFGDVTIDDYANITASAGDGIKAFNYGQGNITVQEFAGTIKPASAHSLTYGITADQESGGSGNITITIDSGATVTGNTGIFALLTGTGTVEITNDGTITGATGQAIGLSFPTGNTTDTATIYNNGEINGAITLTASTTVYNDAGATWNTGALSNNGLIIDGGIFDVTGAVTGTGTVGINSGGIADFLSTFDQNLTFSGAGMAELAQPSAYTATISDFNVGDVLNLTGLQYASGDQVVWTQNGSGGTLAIDSSGGTQLESFQLAGTYVTSDFALTPDSSSASAGTDVVFNSPDYWGSFTFPSQPTSETRLQGSTPQVDALFNAVSVPYTSIADYNSSNLTGPYSLTRNVLTLDPFFLPTSFGNEVA